MTASQMPKRWSVARSAAASMTSGVVSTTGYVSRQPRMASRAPGLAHENVEQLPQDLNGNDDRFLRKSARNVENGIALVRVVDAFRIGEDVGIECDPHGSFS